jgi:hypothetical protein
MSCMFKIIKGLQSKTEDSYRVHLEPSLVSVVQTMQTILGYPAADVVIMFTSH